MNEPSSESTDTGSQTIPETTRPHSYDIPPPGSPKEPFPKPGHQFGRYTLLRKVGRGGMGYVYEARDTVLDGPTAVKVPLAGSNCPERTRDSFLHEARLGNWIATQLPHFMTGYICRVTNTGEFEGCPFIAMDYIAGVPLTSYWSQERERLGPWGAADMVMELARFLARIHQLGELGHSVIHRDLKPDNILVVAGHGAIPPRFVILDFGIALMLDPERPDTGSSAIAGTLLYMSPEQMAPDVFSNMLTPRADIYSLGVIFYELLTGHRPYSGSNYGELRKAVLAGNITPPGDRDATLRPFDAICARAMACTPEARYESMEAFAADLEAAAQARTLRTTLPTGDATPSAPTDQPTIAPTAIQYKFVAPGSTAPELAGRDQLYLDVGNRLAPGVIDHHQLGVHVPTARLVVAHPELIDASVSKTRAATDPFTIVLHRYPDMDAVASTFLATTYLTERRFPAQVEPLLAYVERVDSGENCVTPERPFTVYAAFQRIAARAATDTMPPFDRWRRIVADGIALFRRVLQAVEAGKQIETLDAFAVPGLFDDSDRLALTQDVDRYRAKLSEPATAARRARLRLSTQAGRDVYLEGLLVRNVQNASDPTRCAYFKDWARGDVKGSRDGKGYAALSVFMPQEPGNPRRCILSVTPTCGATLAGLGALLDAAESERRKALLGVDDRRVNIDTGELLDVRPGYNNSDPWYDGQGHSFTIVDSPRSGTVLTADEIEAIFLKFSHATDIENMDLRQSPV